MKLQLTVPTLERLIGGDTELELDLRKAAAKEFAAKYMRNMLETSVSNELNVMRQDIANLVSNEVCTQLGKNEYKYRASVYVSPETKAHIKNEVEREIGQTLKQTIVDLIKQQAASIDIQKLVRIYLEPAIVERAKLVAKNELINSLK